MGKACAVQGCTTKSDIRKSVNGLELKSMGIFKVPNCDNTRKRWQEILGHKLEKSHFICEEHFLESDVIKGTTFKFPDGTTQYVPRERCSLKKNALPITLAEKLLEQKNKDEVEDEQLEPKEFIKVGPTITQQVHQHCISPDENDTLESLLEKENQESPLDEIDLDFPPEKDETITVLKPLEKPSEETRNAEENKVTLDNIIGSLREVPLPEGWCWISKKNSINFIFRNIITFKDKLSVILGEDLYVTIYIAQGHQLRLDIPITSFEVLLQYIQDIQRLELCTGVFKASEKYSSKCVGFLSKEESYKVHRTFPRCSKCKIFRNNLLRKFKSEEGMHKNFGVN